MFDLWLHKLDDHVLQFIKDPNIELINIENDALGMVQKTITLSLFDDSFMVINFALIAIQ